MTSLWRSLALATILVACNKGGPFENDGGHDASMLYFFPANLADPIKVISQTDDDVVATVTAGDMLFQDATLGGRKYTQLRLPGFSSNAKPGYPEVPGVEVLVSVPRGMTLSYEIIEKERAEEKKLEHDLAFQYQLPIHSGKPTFATRSLDGYREVSGADLVEILDVSYAGAEKLATIRFHPVKYDPARKTVSLTRFYKVHFFFKPSLGLTADVPPVGGEGTGLYRSLSINNEGGAPRSSYAAKLDLIIADESLREPLARYIAFKKQRGRQVKEHYVTGKSAEDIKALISTEYKSGTPPAHTMLVGNITMIPSNRGSADNTWTDYPYQTLDGGSKPDVSLGRVPAHNAAELNAWIDKAIARETQPRKYDDILLTAGSDTGLGCPTNVTAVGGKFQSGGNKATLTQKFRTNVGSADVYAAYNAEPNIIVYDGHGNQDGMSEIPLNISDLSKLTNKSFPIILDIACLNANWQGGASRRNFAESILLKAGAGAAGIMASGGSGNGHEYFQTIASIMASGRAGSATGDKMSEIGQVILAAKVKHPGQDSTFWNYYGDPGSSTWEPETVGTGGTDTSPATATATGTGTGTGTGTTTTPPAAGTAVMYAALSATDVLFASVAGTGSKGMSYCLGDKATCGKAGASWIGMTKARDGNGVEVYGAKAALSISGAMSVTLFGKTSDDKETLKEVKIQAK